MKRIVLLIIALVCTVAQWPTAAHADSVFHPVDPTLYSDNMTVVIRLTRGTETITTAELGAFIDGECRGVASLIGQNYFLLIAGEGRGQAIEIRAAIDGRVQVVCNSLTYTVNGSIGTILAPFVINILDLNDDGLIDIADVIILTKAVMTGSDDPRYDINDDLTVDANDVNALIKVIAQGASSAQ